VRQCERRAGYFGELPDETSHLVLEWGYFGELPHETSYLVLEWGDSGELPSERDCRLIVDRAEQPVKAAQRNSEALIGNKGGLEKLTER